ncbi:delta-60 repeat domain-containing protein [Gilvimarinus algae]|uniref:Delta-60 repeat domain-containing protein n=1 Tax=Gilvimarinus algae TaxID=3058037 RepID=A0ABT8TEB3_9GAMM|nr:delta-60 repeat domain-containing protein [Gilvimarinus sp. SDUM040014]MDO3382441.1 delta-60 repeat domain-containing protein [Gilvimarinus sp. SDUM040014]
MKQLRALGVAYALSIISGAVLAAPGDLDTTFNGTGYSIINTPSNAAPDNTQDYGHALTLDSSGNIIVAGNSADFASSDFMLARFTSAGLPDPTFGGGDGFIVDDFSGFGDTAYGVAVDGSGNIAVTGRVNLRFGVLDFGIALYDSSGNLNPAFNGTGRVTIDSGTANDEGDDIAFDSAGRIVAAGDLNGNMAVVRYNLDGTPDNSFAGTGQAIAQPGDAEAMVIDSAGRIVVAGRQGNNFILISRFNDNGTLDGSFGSGGNLSINLGGTNARADSVTVDSSNRIIVAGNANPGSGAQFYAARFNTDGTLDTSFNGTGYHIVDISAGFDSAYAVEVTSTGEIVIAGNAGSNTGIVSFNADGTLNTDFATGGIANVDKTGTGQQDWSNDMVLDSSDRIVTAGQFFITGPRYGLFAARFEPAVSAPPPPPAAEAVSLPASSLVSILLMGTLLLLGGCFGLRRKRI